LAPLIEEPLLLNAFAADFWLGSASATGNAEPLTRGSMANSKREQL